MKQENYFSFIIFINSSVEISISLKIAFWGYLCHDELAHIPAFCPHEPLLDGLCRFGDGDKILNFPIPLVVVYLLLLEV